MTFLSLNLALWAAAAAVPLLVLLYFLKLRRQDMAVSSTLLWRRAVQDLQVNAPFQRLRRNLLLLLQLLAMLAMLAALSRPVVRLSAGVGKRYVLLIDRSASMSATDVSPTRLDEAKRLARELVATFRATTNLGMQDAGDQAMVVAFDEHAKVLCNFTSDRRQIEAAIDAVAPTDGRSMLGEALTVARAFAQAVGGETNNRSAETPAQLELFSDGRIADAAGISLARGEMNFHRVGRTGENLAVVAAQARRSFEKIQEVEVFVTVANFGAAPQKTDVQLSLDGQVRSVRPLDVPAARPADARSAGGPGLASLSFSLTHAQAAVVEVRQTSKDLLPADDAAWAILPPPRRISALLVTAGDAPLKSALQSCPLQKLDIRTPAEFDAMDIDAMSLKPPYDVIILDNCAPPRLPRGRFIVFGRPPRESGATIDQELKDQVVVDWRTRHPILQYVNLTNLYAARCFKLKLPAEASVLAEFTDASALALVRSPRGVFLLAPFDPLQTNWPFEPSFVLFCYNATAYLGMEMSQQAEASLRVNQAISLEQLPPNQGVTVTVPGGREDRLAVSASGTIHYPGTLRCGVYRVAVGSLAPRDLAVNLLDPAESEIAPADTLRLLGQELSPAQPVQAATMELWPVLALLGLVLASIEWLVYNRRARL